VEHDGLRDDRELIVGERVHEAVVVVVDADRDRPHRDVADLDVELHPVLPVREVALHGRLPAAPVLTSVAGLEEHRVAGVLYEAVVEQRDLLIRVADERTHERPGRRRLVAPAGRLRVREDHRARGDGERSRREPTPDLCLHRAISSRARSVTSGRVAAHPLCSTACIETQDARRGVPPIDHLCRIRTTKGGRAQCLWHVTCARQGRYALAQECADTGTRQRPEKPAIDSAPAVRPSRKVADRQRLDGSPASSCRPLPFHVSNPTG
jgi:hypothetical protein